GRPPKYSSSAPCSPKTTSPVPNGLGEPGNKRFKYRRFITEDSPPDEDDDHENACTVCKSNGELLMCDTCNLVYHLKCLDPPLTGIPSGMWICPKCKVRSIDKAVMKLRANTD
ncbi:PHD finger protein 21A-like, partial [Actinia tenebrosa]|uniref:PHD finger protein 21A-like n=1 Tax=Actinia tenebrosa TaxID=6105 RepID=A0A6P8I9V1_ACTTE